MASIRVTLTHEARRLAAADTAGDSAGTVGVPSASVARLERMARTSGRPVQVLRWAWRSQAASYIDSRQFVDGVATIYLHATLLAAERCAHGVDSAEPVDPATSAEQAAFVASRARHR